MLRKLFLLLALTSLAHGAGETSANRLSSTNGAPVVEVGSGTLTMPGVAGSGTSGYVLTSSGTTVTFQPASGGSGTATYASTAGYATNSGYATNADSATSATYASSAAYSTNSGFATNAAGTGGVAFGSAATNAASAFDTNGAAAAVKASSLQSTNNLSDVASPASARTNLGISASASTALTNAANAVGGFPTVTGANTIAQNTSGAAAATQAAPGSVAIMNGDSITTGVPYLGYASGAQYNVSNSTGTSTPYGSPWPQQMSALPFWHNIPIYDMGVPGTRASDGVSSFTSNVGGTEYMNGALVGSYGGVTTTPSALYSATGTTYYFNYFGINDQTAGYTPAQYIGYMTTLYGLEKAKGSNVVVTAFTSVQSSQSALFYASTGNTVTAYNTALRALSSIGVIWDRLADVAGLLPAAAGQNYSAGLQQSDMVHYTSAGYNVIALEAYRASTGISLIPNPASVYSGLLGYFYGANGNPTFDPRTGNLYNSSVAGDNTLNEGNRQLLSGGSSVFQWGSTIYVNAPEQISAAQVYTPPITTVNGSTSGSANFFCIAGPGGYFKMYVITMSALNGTASYTFPSSFGSGTPNVVNNDAAVTSISTTGVTVTGSTTTRTIIIMGS